MSDLIKQIEELNLRCDSSTLLPIILQVDQLRKERDEARQQVCRQMLLRGVLFHRIGAASVAVTEPSDVAKWMGWDCFKEETP